MAQESAAGAFANYLNRSPGDDSDDKKVMGDQMKRQTKPPGKLYELKTKIQTSMADDSKSRRKGTTLKGGGSSGRTAKYMGRKSKGARMRKGAALKG